MVLAPRELALGVRNRSRMSRALTHSTDKSLPTCRGGVPASCCRSGGGTRPHLLFASLLMPASMGPATRREPHGTRHRVPPKVDVAGEASVQVVGVTPLGCTPVVRCISGRETRAGSSEGESDLARVPA